MYFLKTRGTDKIPDFIQLRDDQFVLIAHFKMLNPEQSIKKLGLEEHEPQILTLIKSAPFGKLYKL
jgi:hypothetical protein